MLCSACDVSSDLWTPRLESAFTEATGAAPDLFEALRGDADATFAAVFADGETVAEKQKKAKATLIGLLPDGTGYSITVARDLGKKPASIKVDGVEVAPSGQGICLVVYDNDMGSVVDSATFDTRGQSVTVRHDTKYVKRFRLSMLEYENSLLAEL